MRIIITDCVHMFPIRIVIDSYETYLSGSNSHSYKAKFKYDIPYFHVFLLSKFTSPCLEHITRGVIEEFIDDRLKVESPSTVARRFASIQSMCRWCAATYETFKDPCFRWSSPISVDKREPKCIGKDMLQKLITSLEQYKDSPYYYYRDKVVVLLCAHAGLRCDEVRCLCLASIGDDWLTQIKGKGRHYRRIPLSPELKQAIAEFLPVRDSVMRNHYRLYANLSQADKNLYPLIVRTKTPKEHSPSKYAVCNKTIRRIVNDLGKLAGCPTLHPHALRHEFAHELLDKTKNIAIVAKALGHRSIVTTMIYTDQTDQELVKAMQ